MRISCKAPAFASYVEASFDQIRRAARSNLHVTLHLLRVLRGLLDRATDERHASALRNQLDDVVEGFDRSTLGRRDEALLLRGWRP